MEVTIWIVAIVLIVAGFIFAMYKDNQAEAEIIREARIKREEKWAEILKEPKYLIKFTVGTEVYSTKVCEHYKAKHYRFFYSKSSKEVAKARLIGFYESGIFRAESGVTYPRHTITNTWIEKEV